MSKETNIAWCDSTVNFWSGCTMVSPGCAHCYAEVRDRRHMIEPVSHWGKGAPRLKHVGAVKQALAMNRQPLICDHCGLAQPCAGSMDEGCLNRDCPSNINPQVECSFHKRRIFSLSLGDWLDEEVPIEWLAEMLDTIRQCDQVVWILCTKRPENFINRLSHIPAHKYSLEFVEWYRDWAQGTPPKNVWLLTSVENQALADERIPELLKIPAVIRGLSLEPLLGPVSLRWASWHPISKLPGTSTNHLDGARMLDWLIIGGESGKDARPCHVYWIRSLLIQGREAGVATFVKQFGARPLLKPGCQNHFDWKYKTANAKRPDDKMFMKDGDMWRILFSDKKGGDPTEWMEHYRIQDFPNAEGILARGGLTT